MHNLAAFLTYAMVTTFTPGPNNIMAMTNAGKHGFRRSLPFCLGVGAGSLLILGACIAFSAALYSALPKVQPVMTVLGAAYMLWLAWKVWRSKPGAHGEGKTQLNFFTAIALQFVNPKGILYFITIATTFLQPAGLRIPALVGVTIFLAILCLASTCCWALGGSLFQRLFERHARVVNAIMALLLVYCAVSLFLPH